MISGFFILPYEDTVKLIMAYFDTCPPEGRLGIPAALAWPGGLRVFTIVDADQRCCIELSVEDEDAEDDFAMDTIARHSLIPTSH